MSETSAKYGAVPLDENTPLVRPTQRHQGRGIRAVLVGALALAGRTEAGRTEFGSSTPETTGRLDGAAAAGVPLAVAVAVAVAAPSRRAIFSYPEARSSGARSPVPLLS